MKQKTEETIEQPVSEPPDKTKQPDPLAELRAEKALVEAGYGEADVEAMS